MEARRRRDWGSALPLWEQLVEAAPRSESWRARLVECAARAGAAALATEHATVLAARPGRRNRAALLDAAEALTEHGAPQHAEGLLRPLAEEPALAARHRYLLGRLRAAQGRPAEAIRAYQASVAAGDTRGRAARALAGLAAANRPGRTSAAPLPDLAQLLRGARGETEAAPAPPRADPAAAAAHHARARVLGEAGDTAGRVAALFDALGADPFRHAARRELARHLLSAQRWQEAALEWEFLAGAGPPDDGEAPASLGRARLGLGHAASAAAAFRWALSVAPGRVDAALGLARSLAALGEDPAATAAAWRAVLALDPGREEARRALLALELAAALGAAGHAEAGPEAVTQALAALETLADGHPTRVEVPLEAARLARRHGRPAAEERGWRRVLAAAPLHREALRGLSDLLVAGGWEGEALALWAAALDRAPGFGEAQLRAGRIHARRGDREAAEAAYRAAHALEPAQPAILAQLVQHLSGTVATRAEAAMLIRQWRTLDPANPEPVLREARLLETLARPVEAEAVLLEALALAPAADRPAAALAGFLARQGRWEEAVAAAEAWAALRPDSPEPPLARIQALTELGCTAEVDAAFAALHDRFPDNFAALMGLARARRRLGALDEACRLWAAAATLRPEAEEPWRRLVATLANADREAEALTAFAGAEAALGSGGEGLLARANIMDAARFPDRAEALYERAAAALPDDPRPRRDRGRSLAREGVLDRALRELAAARRLDGADADLARELAEVAELLDYLGHDVLAVARAGVGTAPVLAPEALFACSAAVVRAEAPSYEPVPGRVFLANGALGAGGAERQLVTTLRGLTRPGMGLERVGLLCRSLDPATGRDFYLPDVRATGAAVMVPTPEAVAAAEADPVVRRHLRLLERLPEDMGPMRHWIALLRRERPAVVHAWQDMTALSVGLAAVLAGVPRVVLGTRSVRPDNPRRRLRRWMREAYRHLLALPGVRMVNNSRAGAEDYEDWLDLETGSVRVVYNGMDFDALGRDADPAASRRLKASLGIPAAAPVLGGVLRLSEEKRPLLWIETAHALLGRVPDAHFVLCGDGPLAPEVRAYAAANGLASRLHMPGNQSRIALWYGLMDVVLLSSRHEGLPNVLMEAQALGVPVVVPAVGGAPEVLDEGVTGFAVPDATAGLLAERIARAISDTGWRRRARARAPDYVRRKFGIEEMLRRTLDEYGMPAPHG